MIRTVVPSEIPVTGRTRMPGSKSHSNRALVIATLAAGVSRLRGVSPGDDTKRLISVLRELGAQIEPSTDGSELTVTGTGGSIRAKRQEFDLGLAGTSFRFVLPLCALASDQELTLTGNSRMRERPMGDLIESLRDMGASLVELGTPGCPPLAIQGVERLRGGRVRVDGRTSSQFISALLMIAPVLDEGMLLEVRGPLVSESYVEMTRCCMREFGVQVAQEPADDDDRIYRVEPTSRYKPAVVDISGDASGASYFWGLAAVSGGSVRIDQLAPEAQLPTATGDLRFPEILATMGCEVQRGIDDGCGWIEVQGPGELVATDVDLTDLPDTAQTLAVIASFARGTTTIRGLSTLRHKETDRVRALHEQLANLGIRSTVTDHSISIEGGQPHGATVKTYGDHRMAMAFSLVGARIAGIRIEDPDVVTKSLPGFWEQLAELGVRSDAGQ